MTWSSNITSFRLRWWWCILLSSAICQWTFPRALRYFQTLEVCRPCKVHLTQTAGLRTACRAGCSATKERKIWCVLRATVGAVGDEKMASSTHARRKIHEGYQWLLRGEQLLLISSWRLRFSTECTPIFQTVLCIKVDTMLTSENTMYSSTLYILHHLPTPFNFLTSPGSARDSLAVSGCDVVIVKPKRHWLPRQSIAWPSGWWRRNTKETWVIDR